MNTAKKLIYDDIFDPTLYWAESPSIDNILDEEAD